MSRFRTSGKRRGKALEDVGILPNGLPMCRWCKSEVRPPKRTFCSPECVHEWKLRSDPRYLRDSVFARDKGVCAICHRDMVSLRVALYGRHSSSNEAFESICKDFGVDKLPIMDSLWCADHIKPVCEGGGETGLDNIQTLCVFCHKVKSARETSERTRKKAK